MISTVNVGLQYGGRELFKNVDMTFTKGNCYGLIGANGAGQSTFLKILSGEIEPNKGEVIYTPGERLSVLKQNHFEFDDYSVIRTVLMGNMELCKIMDERDDLYSKTDLTEEEGIRVCEIEDEFAEMGGYSAESDAEILLNGLGVTNEFHYLQMNELTDAMKELAIKYGMTGVDFSGTRYDMGNKLGILKANVEVALNHPEIGEDFKNYLKDLVETL